ncbi:Retrotransposon gag domain [Arabidopsis thaliana x Arabidopsis arenosa]|uniref:Retrotransposon gag domain n=1 Tax=Arabidopsis thaliana x Arabidopsis arenosa TaxID=1240361 RepID=A0A8T2BCT1_9BRAS|nr:Retrotransposon gag domain [Arabidopsis thaliana x Arabidopsis arenosa]
MVAGTRSHTTATVATQEQEDPLGSRLEEAIALQNKKIEEQNTRIEKNLGEMFTALSLIAGKLNSGAAIQHPSPSQPSPGRSMTPENTFPSPEVLRGYRQPNQNPYTAVTRLGKIDFPRFHGDDVMEWLFKAEQFFEMDFTPDEMKVRMSSVHFDGVAGKWHQSLFQSDLGRNLLHDWSKYKELLIERFAEVHDDPIAELKQLQETDGIKAYHEKFELIRMRVTLSEDYLVSAYLAGLRTDTQMHLRMFEPHTVRQCYSLGRLYEKAHPTQGGVTGWSGVKGQGGGNTQWAGRGSGANSQNKNLLTYKSDKDLKVTPYTGGNKGKEMSSQPRKFLSNEEMNRRRSLGLCYYCDEKYTPEHFLTHKKPQLYYLDADEAGEVEVHGEEAMLDEEETGVVAKISVNAISGIDDYSTMRVKGNYGKHNLFMLVDSGSTHNFIDPRVAERLQCELLPAGKTRVTVADGRRVGVSTRINNLKWNFRATEFSGDFLVLPLGGCDAVLGVQWLKTLGPITWDFDILEMQFNHASKRVCLHGIKQGSVREVKAIKVNELQEEQVQLSMICVHNLPIEETVTIGSIEVDQQQQRQLIPDVEQLIEAYTAIFAVPADLPPFRQNLDHKISLLERSNPINQRPYRYAVYQKDEIDKIVKDMLTSGTIQPSCNPYASPVVLVKKKNGTLRLCVDYRGLNNMTVKDRFPIPLIGDLMDELGGSTVYSKIEGMKTVFQLMKDNSLFAKQSNCEVATDKVEYLGHYIEAKGISTDPHKIHAINDWPVPQNLKQLRGFLGLAGYYRRFVRNFGVLARPLTALTKKDGFAWHTEAQDAFLILKKALCEATWEFLYDLLRKFPSFEPCGQGSSDQGALIQ